MRFAIPVLNLFALAFGVLAAEDAKPASVIRLCGADAMVPLLKHLGKAYSTANPQVGIEVAGGGASKGAKEALAGTVELGMLSREPEEDETARGTVIPIAQDAVFMTISAQNPVAAALAAKGITRKQAQSAWLGGQSITWGQLSGGSDATPVNVYTRQDNCGAAEVFAKFLGSSQADLTGKQIKGDNGIAEALKKDPGGLAYNNLQAAYDLNKGTPAEGLLVVSLDANNNGKIDPEESLANKESAFAAIAAGKYPAPPARRLNLIVKGKFQGQVLAFVQWILKDGQAEVAKAGFITLGEAAIKDAQSKLGQ